MRLYFDMNIYNRIFDDQGQLRIRLETMAIDMIFELIEKGQYQLYWSFMLEDENEDNPFLHRRSYIKKLSRICSVSVTPGPKIKETAKKIMENCNIRVKDALHLACAIYSQCDYFITCDDKLIRTISSNEANLNQILKSTKLMNPVDFLRKELSFDGFE